VGDGKGWPTDEEMDVSTQTGSWWRQIFHWPLFVVLAAVHIAVLPQLLSEREDDILSVVAGGLYLALAIADWWSRDRLGEVDRPR
jgi:hypothetical protein